MARMAAMCLLMERLAEIRLVALLQLLFLLLTNLRELAACQAPWLLQRLQTLRWSKMKKVPATLLLLLLDMAIVVPAKLCQLQALMEVECHLLQLPASHNRTNIHKGVMRSLSIIKLNINHPILAMSRSGDSLAKVSNISNLKSI